MPSTRRYLSGVAYTTGVQRTLDTLVSEGVLESSTCETLQAAGVRHFLEDARPIDEMWTAAAEGCLRAQGIAGEEVDAVVVLGFEAESRAAARGIAATGCRRAMMLTLSLQDCGDMSAALRVASALIDGTTVNTVMVVACARCRQPTERIHPYLKVAFSDGAAACIVSAHTGTFEILSSCSMTDMSLAANWHAGGSVMHSLPGSVELMRSVVDSACRVAKTDLPEIRIAFCSSPNRDLLRFMCHAIRLPVANVYQQMLVDHGHMLCCDGLIGLCDYLQRHALRSDDRLLLYSWAPSGVGATVLRYAEPSASRSRRAQ